jgi:hypothetical protein
VDSVADDEVLMSDSGSAGDVPAADRRGEEEPAIADVHAAGRDDEGDGDRSERDRARDGDGRRKGRVWQVRPGHKQSGERRLHQRRALCVLSSSFESR